MKPHSYDDQRIILNEFLADLLAEKTQPDAYASKTEKTKPPSAVSVSPKGGLQVVGSEQFVIVAMTIFFLGAGSLMSLGIDLIEPPLSPTIQRDGERP
ncbi:hypothetical protein [Ruegeria hyattellae]|uniref:hypothetical protein n=1 Tax=Ruegeria hyattellae TaxID=3233337 RepID=UPI00355C34C0